MVLFRQLFESPDSAESVVGNGRDRSHNFDRSLHVHFDGLNLRIRRIL